MARRLCRATQRLAEAESFERLEIADVPAFGSGDTEKKIVSTAGEPSL